MDIAVVGAGRVGTALAVLLAGAGHRVVGASGREASRARIDAFLPGVPFVPAAEATRRAEVVLIGVPDDAVARTCAGLAEEGAFRPGQVVAHLSGSVSLQALGPARDAGAEVLSLHPAQTVPDVESGIERLPGSHVAVTAENEEGYAVGMRLAEDAGTQPFRLDEERKPLYHAAAVFCSNYLAAVEGVAERLFGRAGVDRPMEVLAPLAGASLENLIRLGPARALTGPAIRGDAGTVRRNLQALREHAPEAVAVYIALAGATLDLAANRMEPGAREGVEEELARWR